MNPVATECPLCQTAGGELVWQDEQLRVIRPYEPQWPGLLRVVWQAHTAEMSDLAIAQRDYLMRIVYLVEQCQREVLKPDKINLASFGNYVPHLHWHVIPRFADDLTFPDSIWSAPRRDAAQALERAHVRQELVASLCALVAHKCRAS